MTAIKVPPQWPSTSPCKLAFVGEAPGSEEILKGAPLVGPSGKIFNAMLRAAEIERKECLVTNVFDEKAPGNDVTDWMKDGAIYEPALQRLSQELLKCSPNVVVALGGTALWALTSSDAVGSMRGTLLKATRVVPGIKVFPTYHPMFIQKQWKYYTVVIHDLIRAAAEAEKGPELVYPKRKLYVEPTMDDLYWLLDMCDVAEGPVSVDIETGWGQVTCIGFAPCAEWGMCVPFVDLRKPSRSYWKTEAEELEAWKIIKAILEGPVPKLGQYFGGYDMPFLRDVMGIRVQNYLHDTKLLHHALYPELPHRLEFLGAAYTNLGAWKFWNSKGDKKDG